MMFVDNNFQKIFGLTTSESRVYKPDIFHYDSGNFVFAVQLNRRQFTENPYSAGTYTYLLVYEIIRFSSDILYIVYRYSRVEMCHFLGSCSINIFVSVSHPPGSSIYCFFSNFDTVVAEDKTMGPRLMINDHRRLTYVP